MARERLRYIDDGYTEDGFVRKRPGMWDDDLRFLYRPMTLTERKKLTYELSRKRDDDIDGQLELQMKAVAKKIIEWDYRDKNGKDIPISPASILRMKPMLSEAVCSIVCGFEPSDADGERPHLKETNDEAALQRIFGNSEETQEGFDAKNSETG